MAKQPTIAKFEALFHQYRGRVFQTAYLILGDSREAEDVLQEVFLKVYRSGNSFDPEKGGFAAWLYRIVVNQCISCRRRKRRPSSSLESLREEGFDPPADTPSVPEELLAEERIEALRQAVGTMKENHRVILVMRYFNELSYEEIASVLGIPLGTVQSRLNRAMNVLRRELKKEEFAP